MIDLSITYDVESEPQAYEVRAEERLEEILEGLEISLPPDAELMSQNVEWQLIGVERIEED